MADARSGGGGGGGEGQGTHLAARRTRRHRGAVVIRSADPEALLQGVRAALGLCLGDRPADLYLLGEGGVALSAPPGSEAGEGLSSLWESGIGILVEVGADPGSGAARFHRLSREQLLIMLQDAAFQQTF